MSIFNYVCDGFYLIEKLRSIYDGFWSYKRAAEDQTLPPTTRFINATAQCVFACLELGDLCIAPTAKGKIGLNSAAGAADVIRGVVQKYTTDIPTPDPLRTAASRTVENLQITLNTNPEQICGSTKVAKETLTEMVDNYRLIERLERDMPRVKASVTEFFEIGTNNLDRLRARQAAVRQEIRNLHERVFEIQDQIAQELQAQRQRTAPPQPVGNVASSSSSSSSSHSTV